MTTQDYNAAGNLLRLMSKDNSIHTITAFHPATNTSKHRIRLTRYAKGDEDFRIVAGRPNYEEREFLKQCRVAGCNPKSTLIKRFK